MKTDSDKRIFSKIAVKILNWFLGAFLILFAILTLVIQIPFIQTYLVQQVSASLSKKLETPVTVGSVNVQWFDEVKLTDLLVRDSEKDTLIFVSNLFLNYELRNVFADEYTYLDKATLDHAKVVLQKNAPDEQMNISFFVNQLKDLFAKPKQQRSGKKPFSIKKIKLTNSSFSLNDIQKDSIFDRWDNSHFTLNQINAELSELGVKGDTFRVKVKNLSTIDKQTGLRVHELNATYSISQQGMHFKGLNVKAGKSSFSNDISFLYDGTTNLSYFEDSVTMVSSFTNANIHSRDLGLFAPYFDKFNETYQLSGDFNGRIGQFSFRNFKLIHRQSLLAGNLMMNGLPEIDDTFISLDIYQSNLLSKDFKRHISEKVFEQFAKFGSVRFTGMFTGFTNDFVANGHFITDIGEFDSDINLKINQGASLSTYEGKLATQNLDLGKLLDREDLLQQITMNGKVSGRGFSAETADFSLNATFEKFGFKKYNYQNIITDSRFAKELFIGKLIINDPNLQIYTNALIDLRNPKKIVDVTGSLEKVSFKSLNLSQEEINLSTELDLKLNNFKLDSMIGDIGLRNIEFSYQGRNVKMDSLQITSQKQSGYRIIHLQSDAFAFNANGTFDLTSVINDLKKQYHEYELRIRNQQQEIENYYAQKDSLIESDYYLKYEAELNDINPVLQLFFPQSKISKNIDIEGVFTGGYTSLFTINSHVDSLQLGNSIFTDNLIDIKASKNYNSPEINASAIITSGHQYFSNYSGENFNASINWKEKHIDFSIKNKQADATNYAQLSGELDFLPNLTQITLDSSNLQILEKDWRFRKGNQISISDRKINFHQFEIFHQNQGIEIDGMIADSTDEALIVDIHNFQLENLNTLLKRSHQGKLDGKLTLSNFYDGLILESVLYLKEFRVNEYLIGDIEGETFWDHQYKRLNIGGELSIDDQKVIAMAGYYEPGNQEEQLDIYAYLNSAKLKIAEPFIEDYFSEIEGSLSGEFTIDGMLSEPSISGIGNIQDGHLKVNYLNTSYRFSGALTFDKQKIGIKELTLLDKDDNQSLLTGTIDHNGLKDLILDVDGQMNNFQVLNKPAKDGDLYYGTAEVSGDISFNGSLNNLTISSNARTNKGTRFFIPLEGTSSVEQQNFIQIINKSTLKEIEETDQEISAVDLKGLNLDFDLEVTPDAYCEIIFDIKAGDIIRGRGNGKLNLQIDTQGEFNMIGNLEIEEGAYNFTMYNVVNKEFTILPNSTISWTGDPYKANMDIQATYNQLASLSPLFEDTTFHSHPDVRRKYPAQVILDLKGDLMSPDIDFDIEVDNYPSTIVLNRGGGGESYSLSALVSAFKNTIENDEQELKRQVFSLMVLRRFSPKNSFNVSGSIGNSVSEFISNQLSYWITQFDENLEIDVDLGSMDDEALNTFQLRLSYTMLDGRLRITRNGGFINQQNEADLTSIAGDWTVEYLLSPDGKLRVKMYNRTNYNNFNPATETNATTTAGFSLMHTESFDQLLEIFKNNRKKQKPEEKKEDPGIVQSKLEAKEEEILQPFKEEND